MDTPGDFAAIFQREIGFAYRKLHCTSEVLQIFSQTGSYLYRQEFYPRGSRFFHLKVPRSEKKGKSFHVRVIFLKGVFFLLIWGFRLWIEYMHRLLTLRAPRKTVSENVICLCHLLHLLANFSNLHFAYRQTVWTQIRLLLKEQSDLGPHCLQQ